MHLRFSEDEFGTLIEMISLAAEIASLNQKPGTENHLERFANLEDKILARGCSQGYSEIIEVDPETQQHRVTANYLASSYIQDCIDEMRNEVFWEELSFRLAEKEIIHKLGENTYLTLSEKDKIAQVSPRQKEYWEGFAQNGLKHVHQINPPELG